jgi:hypothetical protein
MLDAFVGVNDISYPLDFWSTPNGDDVKWEIKSIPSLESEEDFNNFKAFCSEFKNDAGYFPLANGAKVLVNGVEYECFITEEDTIEWIDTQSHLDESLTNAVDDAVNRIKGGVSEEFDTLKKIEDWINQSGNTGGNAGVDYSDDINALKASAHTHENKEILDNITSEKINEWDNASKAGGTVLDESITVTINTGNYKNGMTIDEGTSVLEVLKNFLRKTIYPSEATKPSAEIEFGEVLNNAYEVGTKITIPQISIKTENGKFNYEGYEGATLEGGNFTSVKISSELKKGFNGYNENLTPTESPLASQENIQITEGENVIIIEAKVEYDAPTNNPTTNEGVETTQTGETATNNMATWEKGEIKLTETININGYRKVYFGTTSFGSEITETLVKTLKSSNAEVTNDTVFEVETKEDDKHFRMIIAVPKNKTLQLVEDSTSTQDLTKLLLRTEKQITISSANDYDVETYNVYDKSWAGTFGNETWKIVLKDK